MSIVDQYRGGQWEPLDGWQPDDEVIVRLRGLIEQAGGATIDALPQDDFPPDWTRDGIGAAVGLVGDGVAEPHFVVVVSSLLPIDLRADLWALGATLGVMLCEGDVEPNDEGMLFVGIGRSPVTERGTGLLAHLMLRRFGRDSLQVDFPVYRDPAEALVLTP